jgi:hypothetical protein
MCAESCTGDCGAENDEEADTYSVGEESMYRVSMSIGGNAVLPVLQGILGGFVENPVCCAHLCGPDARTAPHRQ